MANDYSKYEIDPYKESLKNEETFIPSAFIDTHKYNGVKALAMKLQELILMEKGTNPAALGMGVGLRNYLFEFIDDQTLTELNNEVKSQQEKYVPTDLIKSMEFVRNDKGDIRDRGTLYLFVHLNSHDPEYTNSYFTIGVAKTNKRESSIISQIYM